jgi:hypothetical protein
MNDNELKEKALNWIESLKGTNWEMHCKFTEVELIQIGKNIINNGGINE